MRRGHITKFESFSSCHDMSEGPNNRNITMTSFVGKPWRPLSYDYTLNRTKFAIAAQNDRYIIVAGGYGELPRSVLVFDVETGSSALLPFLPEGSYHGSCDGTVLKDYFYLISRYGECPAYRINLLTRKTWEKVDGNNRHYGEAVISNDTNLFLFSDHGNEAYVPQTSSWVDLPSMKKPRWAHATAINENKVYIIGGYDDFRHSPSSSVGVYDIQTRTWRKSPSLPRPLYGSAAAVIEKRWIIVTGGEGFDEVRSSLCFIFDIQNQKWIESEIQLSAARSNHGCAVVGKSELVLMGGVNAFDGNVPYVESIKISRLLNWRIIKNFILLRKLFENGQAHPIVNQDSSISDQGSDMILQNVITQLDLDTFRHVLSFLIISY